LAGVAEGRVVISPTTAPTTGDDQWRVIGSNHKAPAAATAAAPLATCAADGDLQNLFRLKAKVAADLSAEAACAD
jgi:hypothetical protein